MNDEELLYVMTSQEWDRAVQTALERIGVTRQELEEQAKADNFSSTEARKLWYLIGRT